MDLETSAAGALQRSEKRIRQEKAQAEAEQERLAKQAAFLGEHPENVARIAEVAAQTAKLREEAQAAALAAAPDAAAQAQADDVEEEEEWSSERAHLMIMEKGLVDRPAMIARQNKLNQALKKAHKAEQARLADQKYREESLALEEELAKQFPNQAPDAAADEAKFDDLPDLISAALRAEFLAPQVDPAPAAIITAEEFLFSLSKENFDKMEALPGDKKAEFKQALYAENNLTPFRGNELLNQFTPPVVAPKWSKTKKAGVVGLIVVGLGVTYKYGKAVATKIANFVSSKIAKSSKTKTKKQTMPSLKEQGFIA
ncbi:MAG: hypothetical protein NT124_05390 [Candidatus Dependentiae bacterium]|nr:hypothetical protein [Candidatus Dependentiae bacterium]